MRHVRRQFSATLAFWLALWWLLLATLTPLTSAASAATLVGGTDGGFPICTVAGLHLADADDAGGTSAQQRAGQHCLLCLGGDLPPTAAAIAWRLPTHVDLPVRPDQRLSPPTDASRLWTLRRKQAPPVLPG